MGNELKSMVKGLWWLILIRGIALLIFGIIILVRPGIAAVVLVQILGIYWIIDGITTIVKSIQGRAVLPSWGWGIVSGVLSVIGAIIILAYPLLTAAMFAGLIVFIVAFLAIFSGVTSIVTGIRLRKEIDNEWSMIIGGFFTVVLGLLILGIRPGFAAVWMVVTFGILAIIGGVTLITVAFKARKAGKNIKEASS